MKFHAKRDEKCHLEIQECWEEGEKKGRGRAKLERKAMEPKDEIAA